MDNAFLSDINRLTYTNSRGIVGGETHSGLCAKQRPRSHGLTLPLLLILVAFLVGFPQPQAKAESPWSFRVVRSPQTQQAAQLEISLHNEVITTYVFRDPQISRPYFANIRVPGQVPLTRLHPPGPNDFNDHPLFHPGLWLAFGDLSGADNWRLKAAVEHNRFVIEPHDDNERLTYQVENVYWDAEHSRELCRELASYTFHTADDHIAIGWNSRFFAGKTQLVFGDQEEMGLGVRLHSDLAVQRNLGGRILNAQGQRNEAEVWGKPSPWVDYSGPLGHQFVGIMLAPSPRNFRPCWFHARDYGFVTANPFGEQAFTQTKQPSRIVVEPDKELLLEFAVILHWHATEHEFDANQIYQKAISHITK